MSDFLSRLAARALGQGPTLRPRLPSRFEPLPAAVEAGWAGEVAAEMETAAAPSAVRPAGPQPPAARADVASTPRREGPAPVGEGEEATPPAHPGRAPAASPEVSEGATAPAATAPEDPPLRPFHARSADPAAAGPAAPPPEPAPSPAVPAEATPRPASFPQAGAPSTSFARRGADPETPRPAGRRAVAAPESTAEPESPVREVLADRSPALPPPAPQPATPLSRSAPHAAGRESRAAAETAVRVTIGRIEVRAAAPAPAAPQPSPSRLTLEEYLRRRREGRR